VEANSDVPLFEKEKTSSLGNYRPIAIITARLFHCIIVLIVLSSMYVRSVRKTFVIVNVDLCYSPQEAGEN
jgi:hypothetical protein